MILGFSVKEMQNNGTTQLQIQLADRVLSHITVRLVHPTLKVVRQEHTCRLLGKQNVSPVWKDIIVQPTYPITNLTLAQKDTSVRMVLIYLPSSRVQVEHSGTKLSERVSMTVMPALRVGIVLGLD